MSQGFAHDRRSVQSFQTVALLNFDPWSLTSTISSFAGIMVSKLSFSSVFIGLLDHKLMKQRIGVLSHPVWLPLCFSVPNKMPLSEQTSQRVRRTIIPNNGSKATSPQSVLIEGAHTRLLALSWHLRPHVNTAQTWCITVLSRWQAESQ